MNRTELKTIPHGVPRPLSERNKQVEEFAEMALKVERLEQLEQGFTDEDADLHVRSRREAVTSRVRDQWFGKFLPHTVEDLLTLPPSTWLIEGLLEEGAQGMLYGPSGEGKSFVAIDWAMSIATGRPWQGRTVKQGQVYYVVAEGGRGIAKRVAAWTEHNGVETNPPALFLLEAVQLRRQCEDFITSIQKQDLRPVLIVLDTFARCFVGGDENTSKETGEFVDAMGRLHTATGAAILVVHHTGKGNDQERGSSALRAAADVMFKVSMTKAKVLVIRNDKQKNHEDAEPISARLYPVLVAKSSGASCVLVPASDIAPDLDLPANQRRALSVLQAFPERVASSTEWRQALERDLGRMVPTRSFDNWRHSLIKKGYVEQVAGQRHIYRLAAIVEAPTNESSGTQPEERPDASAATATTP